MTRKRAPHGLLVVLGLAAGMAVIAEEALSPSTPLSPELTGQMTTPAPADLALPAPPAEAAQSLPPATPESAATSGPPTTPETAVATSGSAAPATDEASQPAGEAQADALFFAPPLPPRSLQTLVDERRDQLRAERNAWLDAYLPGAMPPWFADYNAGVERYRDALRSLWRQRRDYEQARHDGWMDALCPWSKPQRDWSKQRSFETQMRQLDRRQAMEAYRFAPPYGLGGPPVW